ncbi:hypothetical protein HBI39_114530 [Parastagonospora nodorum]|nr:hypothetical protein HBI39_114530 [Parastagonospora nodorum]
MCAKDDLVGRKSSLLTSTQTPNHVDTFSLDFAFSFAAYLSGLKADQHFFVYQNILLLIAFIISYCLFADKLWWNIQQSLLDRATVVPIIILVDKTQLLLILGDIAAYTLLAGFIPITKIRDPLLKSQVYYYCIGKLLSPLENAAKSRILLACADGRTKQCYPTICAILKHYNFNIYVSLATDTLHLLLKGLVMKMLDFMQDMLDDIYPSKQKAIIQQLIAVVSLLFVLKAPFALHFIRAVCDLVTLAQYKRALERINVFKEEFRVYQRTLEEEKNFNYPKWHALTHIIQDIRIYEALDSICTRANSEAHYITIVKQFYSMINKKEYILQICLHNSQRTALLAANYATVVKQSRLSTTVNIQDCTYSTRLILGIQPYSTKLPLSEVAANIAISNFTHAAAVFRRDYVWVQEFKHRDNRRQSRTVTDNRKHIAYIGAFSKVLLFNNNRQIDNTTRMLSVPFKFYDLSTIIRPVHLVPRDLPNSITHEYNRLYLLTFDINLLRTLREYRQKRTRNN